MKTKIKIFFTRNFTRNSEDPHKTRDFGGFTKSSSLSFSAIWKAAKTAAFLLFMRVSSVLSV
jgi:hypothetical protein